MIGHLRETLVLKEHPGWARLVRVVGGDTHATVVTYWDDEKEQDITVEVYDYSLSRLKGPVP